MNNKLAAQTIIECISGKKLMSLTYRRERDGRQISRMVEPYEVKKEDNGEMYLYAYDRIGRYDKKVGKMNRSIKSFRINNIISLTKQAREFKPRY